MPYPEATIGLPRFRIILDFVFLDGLSLEELAHQRWAGRVDKIFVIVWEKMRDNGKAEAVLRSFVDYKFEKWSQIQMDGVVIYSQ